MGEVVVNQVFNNYGNGAFIANNDGVMIINGGKTTKTNIKVDQVPVTNNSKSQCAKCKYGEIIMSGPHEGSGMYVRCKRPKRAIVISGGDIRCDAFVKNDK